MNGPIIVCGLGLVGWRVLEYLQAADLPVVAIDNRASPADPRLDEARLIRDDFRSPTVLHQAGLDHARAVLIVTSDDLANISTALLVRRLRRDVRVVVRMFNQNLLARLGQAVPNIFALSVSALTAPLLAEAALTGEVLSTFDLVGGNWQVAELTVGEPSPLRGQRVGSVAERGGVRVLAHRPAADPERFLAEVDADAELAAGDRLAVCGPAAAMTALFSPEAEGLLPPLRIAGRLRRLGRVLGRTLAEIEPAVLICTLVLLAVVLGSTLVYRFGLGRTLADGLYQTVSVIATGADMRGEGLPEGWQKVFLSGLRLFGAALTGAFTAIVTNYLIRARLSGALDMRRIPDGGHIVVCGLGNIGFRVVEALRRADERVVVIDPATGSRFAGTCRRMGVPMLPGDATVPEVLKQARAATARAVVACTSVDLTNLEIALLARELQPRQRVVVRLADPSFAEALRAAADIRFALSIPNLAAPAFVAALFGDRVRTVFLLGGRLLQVVELTVPAGDPCLEGQTVRAVAVDYGLKPIALASADSPADLDGYPLRAGDRLTVVSEPKGLEQLYRRERPTAEWAVEVTDVPPPARELLARLARTWPGAGPADGDLDRAPFVLRSGLTGGQAEDLLALLRRECVPARRWRSS